MGISQHEVRLKCKTSCKRLEVEPTQSENSAGKRIRPIAVKGTPEFHLVDGAVFSSFRGGYRRMRGNPQRRVLAETLLES
jgi:hypothetical protein